ncbi:flavin monoamine oxidase family protein [uncultured Sphingomonas sp.]|uniref:flavin monoamine oxidase family protein n=1 Tax=uncultured Sphingomonas sp. TaxID=158754 RepID=UPI0035CB32A8
MRAGGIWQVLGEARAANLAAAAEAAPVPGREGETRRRVLKALAATALVAGLPRGTRASATTGGPVAIVGGGIAGLTALWTLTHAGIDARLYEARPRLGGRMYTAHGGGDPLEMGGQLVNTDHHDMAELARTFGVGLIDRRAGRFRSLILADGQPVAEADAVAAMRGIAEQMTRDADRLDRDQAHVAAELDRLSFTGYLDKHAHAVGEPWVRGLLEATARTEYGTEPALASAVELMFNLPSIEGARVDVLSRSDERYVIAGGSSALIDAMAARMAKRIATGKKVAAIDPAAGSAGGVRLVFADKTHVDAAAVIVTSPASITRRIAFGVPLPPLWQRFIAEANLGRNEKVQAQMRSRPWEAVVGRGGNLWHAGTGSATGSKGVTGRCARTPAARCRAAAGPGIWAAPRSSAPPRARRWRRHAPSPPASRRASPAWPPPRPPRAAPPGTAIR